MKFFTFLSALLFSSLFTTAQEVPCPTIDRISRVPISTTAPCRDAIRIFATGDISSDKSVGVVIYAGPNTSGTVLGTACFVVPRNSPSTQYETAPFTYTCGQTYTIAVTRYTASNGQCQGGTCGTVIIRQSGPGGAVLPIILRSFSGIRKGNNVELTWQSESELNALEYQLERNTGNGFAKVANVKADNRLTSSSYNSVDNNASAKISEYRLKMVDKDGSFKYSNVVAIKGTGAASEFTVYPNPVSKGSNAVVKITDLTDATSLSVIDYTGKLIKQLPTNTSTINLSNLQPGSYLIRISNSKTGGNTTQKLSVAN